jgi:hypothetical protein
VIIPDKNAITHSARRNSSRCLLALFACVLLTSPINALAFGAPPLFEQKPEKPYALIYGTVFGPDNRSVYGIKVKIRRADQKKAKWELYSDHSGEFAQRVPAGRVDYIVWADVKSCKVPECKKLQGGTEVTVHVQNDERADINLHLK